MSSMRIAVFGLAGFIVIIDLISLYVISQFIVRKFNKSRPKNISTLDKVILTFTLWAFRNVVFMYLLLIPWNTSILSYISKLFFVIPIIVGALIWIYSLRQSEFRYLYSANYLVLFAIIILVPLYFAGETTFDSFAYHVPIELLIRDAGSLWGWPDIIFPQWGLVGGDITNALYHLAFNSPRIGSSPSILIILYTFLLAMGQKNKLIVAIWILGLISIPSFLGQVNSRYVDTLLAVTLLTLFIYIKNIYFNYDKRVSVIGFIVLVTFASSIKFSALPFLIIITMYLLYKTFYDKKIKTMKELINIPILMFFSVLFGVFPVFLRNYIEFKNPLMPFYLDGLGEGIINIRKFSSQIDASYESMIGVAGESKFYQVYFQYIYTPIDFLIKGLKNLKESGFNVWPDIRSVDGFFAIFTYDNRIGGFGILTIILLFLITFNIKTRYIFLMPLFLLLAIFWPGVIHPRYALILILIPFWLLISYSKNKNSSIQKFINLFSALTLFIFAIINIQSFTNRTYNTGFKFYDFDRHQRILSQWVNPNCKKVVHYGIGLWSGTALWGPNFCGSVVKSDMINGAILDYEIGPKSISNIQLQELDSMVNKYGSDLIIVCTLRWNEETDQESGKRITNLCNDIKIKLDNNKYHLFKYSETINDNFQGPKIQTIEIL
jgi:hypothetical protein